MTIGRVSERYDSSKDRPKPLVKLGPYTLGRKASAVYEKRARRREGSLKAARDMAQLTIPSVFPPEGYQEGDNLDSNEQSIGALCVNTLTSKLMFMALPPDKPVMRFKAIDQKLREEANANPQLWGQIEVATSRLELEHRSRMETTTIRSAYVGATKQLAVAGNVCWEHLDINNPCYHRMDSYVVKRNKKGEPLYTIVKKPTDMDDLDEDVLEMVKSLKPDLYDRYVDGLNTDSTTEADIYAVCKRIKSSSDPHGFKWEYWEEFEGEVIPDTEVTTESSAPPLWPAWMIPMYGFDWGRSYCEEYRGDIIAVENHAAAIADGASAASLMLLFLNPGSRTSIKQVKGAENFSVFPGKAEDLTMFKSEKGVDMQFLIANMEKLAQRLGRAFLLVSSVQRQAERVTAAEWTLMAREIDEAMGGTYSVVAQGFQRIVVTRFVALNNADDKTLPQLDPKLFRIEVITGVEAMGRSYETENLVQATGTASELTAGKALEDVNIRALTERIYVGYGVRTEGLLMTAEEKTARDNKVRQDMMQQTLLQEGTGPAVAALSKTGGNMMEAMAASSGQLTPGAGGGTPSGQEPPAPPQAS